MRENEVVSESALQPKPRVTRRLTMGLVCGAWFLTALLGCGESAAETQRIERERVEKEFEAKETERAAQAKRESRARHCASVVNTQMKVVFKGDGATDKIILTNPMDSGSLALVNLDVTITGETGNSDHKKFTAWRWNCGESITIDGFQQLGDYVVLTVRGDATFENQKINIAPSFHKHRD